MDVLRLKWKKKSLRGSLRRKISALALPTLLPLLVFGGALSLQKTESAERRDVNLSGSLRFRSLEIYYAAQRGHESDWQPALAQMQTICEELGTLYPAETRQTDLRWTAFAGSLRSSGRVDWQTEEAMRLAANQLTARIERRADAQGRNVFRLFACGLLMQGLALTYYARAASRLQQANRERDYSLAALRRQEQRLNHLVENLPAGAIYIEKERIYLNRGAERITGYDRTQLRTIESWFRTLFQERAAEAHAFYELVRAAGFPDHDVMPMRHRDGSLRYVEFAGYISEQGEVWLLTDVTEQLQMYNALIASEAQQQALVSMAADGILILDAKGAILSVNYAAERIWGYETEEVINQNIGLLITACSFFGEEGFLPAPLSRSETAQQAAMREAMGRRKDGSLFPLEVSFGFASQERGPVFVCIARDVTERKEHERQLKDYNLRLEQQIVLVNDQAEKMERQTEELAALATTDGLTGVKNHRAFQESLTANFERCVRSQHPLSLILIDVDNFKQYNDVFGHPAGDAVLKRVAQTIFEASRSADFVARYGGEEFIVILPDTDAIGAMEAGERIRRAVAEQTWEQRDITISIGAVSMTPTTTSAAQMVESADKALYLSKERGRNRVTFAESSIMAPV